MSACTLSIRVSRTPLPLWYEIDTNGVVQVYLTYDNERSSPNRAAGHWHFLLHGRPGAKLTLILNNLDNIWNGRLGSIAREANMTLISEDGRNWRPIPIQQVPVGRLQFEVAVDRSPHVCGARRALSALRPQSIPGQHPKSSARPTQFHWQDC